MPIAQISQAITGLSLIAVLVMLAAMGAAVPLGGMSVFGLSLFENPALVETFTGALAIIGIGQGATGVWLGINVASNMAAAGLVLFALLFWLFGEEEERRQAGQLLAGASIASLLATLLVALPSLAAGLLGGFLAVHAVITLALCQFAAAILHHGQTEPVPGWHDRQSASADRVSALAARAARGTAMTAELFDLSGRRQQP